MKPWLLPKDALRPLVNADLSEGSLDDALEKLGNPEFFVLRVHPYSKHYAESVAFPKHHFEKSEYFPWKFRVFTEPDWEEFEWMVESSDKRIWVEGP